MPVLINPRASELGKANVLLLGAGRRHHVRDFPGPLSIKTVVRGSAVWKTDEGEFPVDETSFLVVNHHQPYSLTIESREPVSTCCAFFESDFVESVQRSLMSPAEALLDDPFASSSPVHFLPRLQMQDHRLLPRIRQLHRAAFGGTTPGTWFEQQMLLLARDLLGLHSQTRREAASVPSERVSTRIEIYKRLCRAREFMHAHRDAPVTLADAARAACLSPYHFHRLFRKTFRETPHQYLVRERLERARYLLAHAEMPVTEVCLACGFESLGSFSTLFRRRFGMPPRGFRRLHSKKQD